MGPASLSQFHHAAAALVALTVFAAWTFATWLFEGRIETLLRPEAVTDRVVYAVVVNLLIGIVAATAVLRVLIHKTGLVAGDAGFGRSTPSPVRLIVACLLGAALYVLQGSPSSDPVVLINAFAQVLVVSIAEVVVCWALLGATFEALLKPWGRAVSLIGAGLIASGLFGLYHFAHSPPFNSPGMVALLTAVGLLTSVFFFAVRDAYATILFHNFLGVFGVVQALEEAAQTQAHEKLQPHLLAMAAVAFVVLAVSDRLMLRTGERVNRWSR